ncbi:MAG: hypothetical protein AB7H97_14750 [Pseudobdellovibrionaceae bacterium]
MTSFSTNSIFHISDKISAVLQKEIIRWQRSQVEAGSSGHYHRRTPSGRTIQIISTILAPKERQYLAPGDYWRMQSQNWIDDPIMLTFKKLLAPIEPFFERINTVEVRTTEAIDFLPHYDGNMNLSSQQPEGFYKLYWNLCIPISEIDEENENPAFYVISEDSKFNLSSNGHFYFFDKTKVLHGVEKRNYKRGIIHITGILKPQSFDRIERHSLQIKNAVPLTEAFGADYRQMHWFRVLDSEENAIAVANQQKKNWNNLY